MVAGGKGDFESQLQMGYGENASLNSELETIYLMPSLQNAFISSTVVRSILQHTEGEYGHLVPKAVKDYILSLKGNSNVCSLEGIDTAAKARKLCN